MPRPITLAPRLALAGFVAAGLPVAILLAVHGATGAPGPTAALATGLVAWLAAGGVLAVVTRRLTGPLERLIAETAEEAVRTRASLEQQVEARTAELSEARDRAERETRLKGVFLAAMSHEIRTPMNSIVGMAELMAETPLDGEQREYCDTIRTSTDALLGVINDILDFSKFEAQGVSLEEIDFDLRLVIEDAVELLAVKAGAASLDLAAVVEPGFDGRFRGDPSRLRQVLVNLLGNAVKFTPQGSVVVRVSTVAGDGTPERVRIEVSDTGIGMSADGLARLFRPFAQADAATTRHFGGTGLGLTISKQIVERMGGRIDVHSTPGHGSTFRVELPLSRSTDVAAAPALASPVASALVLEPREHSADALVRLLTDLGVPTTRVATAIDGLAALDTRPNGFAVAFVSVDAVDAAPLVDALPLHPSSSDTAIVAVVPAGRRGGTGLDGLGSAPRVTRPLRRARLVECLDGVSARQAAAAKPAPASAPSPARGSVPAAPGAPRVLVADDYFANQRLVTRLLERNGYVVEAVGDGQAAIDAVLDRPFDLVLMDCNMPVMDGYAATAQIRALERGGRLPILAMTANDSPEDRAACLRAGMDDYLVKPIQAAIVLAAIARWSAGARARAIPAPAGLTGGSR